MATTLARQIQRSGTTAEWTSVNPILAAGEIGVDKTLNRAKIGDGIKPWSGLGWMNLATEEVASMLAAADLIASATTANDAVMASVAADGESAFAQHLSSTIGAVGDPRFAPRSGLSVKDAAFGAVGDGIAEDGSKIQAAIDAARDAVRSGFATGAGMAYIPSGRYRVTSRIVQPPYVKVVPLGPVVILADVPGDSAWHITPLSTDPSNLYPAALSKQQWLMGDLIDGSHGGISIVNAGAVGTTRGLELGSRTDLGSSRPLARYTLGHIAIQGFAEGLRWNSYHHYIAHYTGIKIELCDVAVKVTGPGTNSGENITFSESLFGTTNGINPAFDIDAPNIDLNFEDCSADFVNTVFLIKKGYGSVKWQGGHIEAVNEGARYSATGGIAVSTVPAAGGIALPEVSIAPFARFVCAERNVQFRGHMWLAVHLAYRVQSSDYTTHQAPSRSVLCDADVLLLDFSLVLPKGGPMVSRSLSLVRDSGFTTDAAGTAGTALTHWALTSGGTVTTELVNDAPSPGQKAVRVTLGSGAYVDFMTKAYGVCVPGEALYATSAYKFMGTPYPAHSIGVYWYDSEKVQIGSVVSQDLNRVSTVAGEWRMPDGPVRFLPPEGAVFFKLRVVLGASAGTGAVDYFFGDVQVSRLVR